MGDRDRSEVSQLHMTDEWQLEIIDTSPQSSGRNHYNAHHAEAKTHQRSCGHVHSPSRSHRQTLIIVLFLLVHLLQMHAVRMDVYPLFLVQRRSERWRSGARSSVC